MSFWMRSGTLQVGPFKYSLDDLAFEFTVPFEDSEQLSVADLIIYNLSDKTRNSIKKGQAVIINAGYEDDIGVIFVGKISEHSSTHKGLEWVTTIKATEAMDEWLTKKVNKTYKKNIDALSVLKDLLHIFGMEVARIELAVNKRYPGGRVCNGHVRDVLKEIVTNDCKSTFVVRHGQIIIRNPNKGTKLGVLLSPGTGLLMTNNQESDKTNITPSQETQKTQKQRAEGGKTFSRESLLNYRIGPGDVIKIRDKALNGDFIVKKGIHKGSRRGDWKTSLEVVPV